MNTTVVIAVVAVLGAGAAGYFAWQEHEAHQQTRNQLAAARAEVQKTRAELTQAQNDAAALRKQVAEQQIALAQLQSEMATARSFIEAERAISARLREELAKSKEELAAAMRGARSAQSRQQAPMLMRVPPPTPVMVEGGRGASVGRAAPAPAR